MNSLILRFNILTKKINYKLQYCIHRPRWTGKITMFFDITQNKKITLSHEVFGVTNKQSGVNLALKVLFNYSSQNMAEQNLLWFSLINPLGDLFLNKGERVFPKHTKPSYNSYITQLTPYIIIVRKVKLAVLAIFDISITVDKFTPGLLDCSLQRVYT